MRNFYFRQLFVAMVALLCSVTASAHDFEVGGIYYNITDKTNLTVEVTYEGVLSAYIKNDYTGNIVIPSTVNYNGKSYSVTSIKESAFSNYNRFILDKDTIVRGVTSVTIPNSVTSIGGYAFYGCTGLTSVTIGNSVTSIGDGAFGGCKGLTSITIPNSVTSIGGSAFHGCKGLTSVTIGNSVTSIERNAFYDCRALTSVTIPNSVTSAERNAFYDCTGLTSVTIPNSVTSIGYDAFDKCSGLTSIIVEGGNKKYDSRNKCNAIIETETNELILGCKNTNIPFSVTSIGYGAFSGCTDLTNITIHFNVTEIRGNAFKGCSGLTSITIPISVTYIGIEAFNGCNALKSIVVNAGNEKYDSRNNCNAIIETETNILIQGCNTTVIPEDVTSIGNDAFYGCSGLTSVTIGDSVTSIGNGAFYNCYGLTSVTIGNSVTSIGDGAFYNCNGLKKVIIGNSVTSIGEEAFFGCSGLTSITIPNSVTSIGDGAFEGCDKLQKIYCNATVPPACGKNVFKDVDKWNCELYVPAESMADYRSADVWSEFFFINEIPTGIEDVTDEDASAIEITGSGIQLTAAEGKAVAVYTAGGALVEKIDSYAGEEITLDKGIYIVRVGGKAVKVKL